MDCVDTSLEAACSATVLNPPRPSGLRPESPRPYDSAGSDLDEDLLRIGEDLIAKYSYLDRDEDSLEELLQPDVDRLDWDFSPLGELVAAASGDPASGASIAPEVVRPVPGAVAAGLPGVDVETQADWVQPYIPPPPRGDVEVQTDPEAQVIEPSRVDFLALPEGLDIDTIMRVVRSDASLTASDVVFHFREQGVRMGPWQAKAVELAAASGMSMLGGWGAEMRQLMASNVGAADYRQLASTIDQSIQRASASLNFSVEQRSWAGLDGPLVRAMTADQERLYLGWCERRRQAVDRVCQAQRLAEARRQSLWECAFLREQQEAEARQRLDTLLRERAARGAPSSGGDGATGGAAGGGPGPSTAESFGRPSEGTRTPGAAGFVYECGSPDSTRGEASSPQYIDLSDSDMELEEFEHV